jgi:hypothetical protein
MKRLKELLSGLAAVLLVPFVAGADSAPAASAESVLAEAQTVATAEHKAIFVHFSASWCKWCKRLEAFLHDEKTEPILRKHFVFVRLVVREREPNTHLDNPGGTDVLARLGGADRGIPFIAVLDAQGRLLANSLLKVDDSNAKDGKENIGYPGEPETIAHFLGMLQTGAPGLTADERQTLEAWLVANAPK